MTTYISATPPPAADASPTSSPVASIIAANPFLSLWLLPFTLTQTWMTAWAKQDGHDAGHIAHDRHHTTTDGDQTPVPAPIEESKDSAVFA